MNQNNQKNNYISIGKILNFHGIQGEAKIGFSKSQSTLLKSLSEVFIRRDDAFVPMEIKSVKLTNKFAILKFKNINSINDIIEYKDSLLYVPSDVLVESLDEDEFLVEDLVGLDVLSKGEKVGVVVGLTSNGATDLLSVRGLSKKISLIPFVKDLVTDVNLEMKQVVINEIQGLLE